MRVSGRRITRWLSLPLCSVLLAFSAHATLPDDTQGTPTDDPQAINSDVSIANIFQLELQKQGSLELAVTAIITRYTEHARTVIRTAIATSPGSIERIIAAALVAGASSEDVAAQCTDSLTADNVQALASTAVRENADPEAMMETCLLAVDVDEAFNVLIAILQNADPQRFDSLLALAIELLDFNGLDGVTIVVNSLVDGNFLTAQGCEGDCLRPLAESLVQDLTVKPSTPARDNSVLVEISGSRSEPVASNS